MLKQLAAQHAGDSALQGLWKALDAIQDQHGPEGITEGIRSIWEDYEGRLDKAVAEIEKLL